MKSTRTAFRYAKATLAYANENKFSDKVAKEMQELIGLHESSDNLTGFLVTHFYQIQKNNQFLDQ